MLLQRHKKHGIDVIVQDREDNNVNHWDPTSQGYAVPSWLLENPTNVWYLADYFGKCLARVAKTGGNQRQHCNGIKAELRPAKRLLADYGMEDAAIIAAYWANKYSCNVSLHYALKHAQEALNEVKHTN